MANTRPNKNIPTEQENPLFHDTWKLLKNYRDAVWNALSTLPMRDLPSPPFPMTIIIFCPLVVGCSTYPINSCNVVMSSGSNSCPTKESHCDGSGASGAYRTGSLFMQNSFCEEKSPDRK